MKISFIPAPLGLAMLGAAALIGAAAPARAEEGTTPPFASVEGLVVAAADAGATTPATLTIHSAFSGDVVLTVDPNTHFRKAGGELDTPDEMPPTPGVPGASLQAAKSPSPTWFVGLFARATYDPSHVTLNVFLSQPDPVLVNGVVDSATATDVVLDVKGRGKLDLTLGPQTAIRLDGLPSTGDKLAAGDLASALFWPSATDNEALRVDARTPPPPPALHFEGTVAGIVMDAGGAPTGFTAARGSSSMSFQESSSTAYWLDGKAATAADLKTGDYVGVAYQADGSVNNALKVMAYTPKPKPTPYPHGTGGDHTGSGGPNGGSNGGSTGSEGGSTGSGDHGSNGNPNPNSDSGKGKPKPPRPLVVGGVVGSVDATGMTFTLSHETRTLTFSVDANTSFQINDQPATFADLKSGQHVYVVYQGTAGGNLALKVLIYQKS
jgi:hypothetical protein